MATVQDCDIRVLSARGNLRRCCVEPGPAEGTECRFLPAEARCISGVFASLSIRASFLYPLCPLLILQGNPRSIASLSVTVF